MDRIDSSSDEAGGCLSVEGDDFQPNAMLRSTTMRESEQLAGVLWDEVLMWDLTLIAIGIECDAAVAAR